MKNILVKSNCKLSLQSHEHRSEHWVVVQGKAEVTINENTTILKPNENIYIPAKSKHRLANNFEEDLVIIEVWYGEILDENDILVEKDADTKSALLGYDISHTNN